MKQASEVIKDSNLQREHLCCLLIDVRTPSLSSSLGSASSLIYQLAVVVCSEGFANPCRIITGLPRNRAPGEAVIGLRSGGSDDSLPGIDSFSRGGDEQFVLLLWDALLISGPNLRGGFWSLDKRRITGYQDERPLISSLLYLTMTTGILRLGSDSWTFNSLLLVEMRLFFSAESTYKLQFLLLQLWRFSSSTLQNISSHYPCRCVWCYFSRRFRLLKFIHGVDVQILPLWSRPVT